MRPCKDCRHIGPWQEPPNSQPRCLHPEAAERLTNWYDGSTYTAVPSIDVARMIGACGTAGRLWEPRCEG